ncbi:dickkopf-related protein 3-like [Stylophora pistillata]|uniref:dickkopf-related protein 3-like n=1 Tax=Stylophora pistillata TaxID=50429 RepID=UPI000C03B08C|nr:dickkopf-related protein 3-like [Stylophora pistillata]
MNSLLSCMILLILFITSWRNEKSVVEGKLKKHSKYTWLPSSPKVDHMGFAKQDLCKTKRDCNKDECCAFVKTKSVKVCRKVRLFGETCNPYERPGLPEECFCHQGLTCRRFASEGFRCLKIITSSQDGEHEEE